MAGHCLQELSKSYWRWDQLRQLEGKDRTDWTNPRTNTHLIEVINEASNLDRVPYFSIASLMAELGVETQKPVDLRAMCLEYLDQRIKAEHGLLDVVAQCKALETMARFHESEEEWEAAAGVLSMLWIRQRDDFKEPVEAVRTGARWVYALIRDENIDAAEKGQLEVEELLNSALPPESVRRTSLEVLLNKALLCLARRKYDKPHEVVSRSTEAEALLLECRDVLQKKLRIPSTGGGHQKWYAPLEAAISIRLGVALLRQRKFENAHTELLNGLTGRVTLGARSGLGRGVPHLANLYLERGRDQLHKNERSEGIRCLKCAAWLYAVGIESQRSKGKKRSQAKALLSRAKVFKLLSEHSSGSDLIEQRNAMKDMSSDYVSFFEDDARPLVHDLAKRIPIDQVTEWSYRGVAISLAKRAEAVAKETVSDDICKDSQAFVRDLMKRENKVAKAVRA